MPTAANSSSVVILHGATVTEEERNAARFVAELGGSVVFVRLHETEANTDASIAAAVPQGSVVVVRAQTLLASETEDRLSALTARAAHCFVFDFSGCERHEELLARLTRGTVRATRKESARTGRFSVTSEHPNLCHQMSGLTFTGPVRETEATFAGQKGPDATDLLLLDGAPLALVLQHGTAQVVAVASGDIASLDEPLRGRAPTTGFFSRIAPLLMFLRRACGNGLWHGGTSRACLIIDDPLLQPRYGFLDFQKLFDVMQREQFSTSIAFIPWNHRRSNAHIADLFRTFTPQLSVCVHGCDHTGAEFASTDRDFLTGQASRGLRWMEKHRALTSVPFDDVMVFPQGHFSTAAIDAIQSCGYLAAVNSTTLPVDAENDAPVLRDLIDVAVTRFAGFPLFHRHYPDDLAGLAWDLFLGKPAFLVEHHGYFRDGYESLARVVRQLKLMEPQLRWTSPRGICSQAYQSRTAESGDVLVRFCTDRFSFRNETTKRQHFVLIRTHLATRPIRSLTINGVTADRVDESTGIVGRVELSPGELVEVDVMRDPVAIDAGKRNPTWRVKVFIRRHLSEFRDNHVDPSPLLASAATRIRKHLRRGAQKPI